MRRAWDPRPLRPVPELPVARTDRLSHDHVPKRERALGGMLTSALAMGPVSARLETAADLQLLLGRMGRYELPTSASRTLRSRLAVDVGGPMRPESRRSRSSTDGCGHERPQDRRGMAYPTWRRMAAPDATLERADPLRTFPWADNVRILAISAKERASCR